MIIISKDEAMAVRERYGDSVHIAITNRTKKSNRKHYYVEETNKVLFFLERYRAKQTRKNAKKREVEA